MDLALGHAPAQFHFTNSETAGEVHLGHILTAIRLNVLQLGEWLLETVRANTRPTPFARLMADVAVA